MTDQEQELQDICDLLNAWREKYGRDAIKATRGLHRYAPIAQQPHSGGKPNHWHLNKFSDIDMWTKGKA